MLNPNPDQQSGVLASLSPETLDKLADLVVAKLVARNDRSCFPSKHSLCGFKIAQKGAARKMTLHNDITFNDLALVVRGYILN